MKVGCWCCKVNGGSDVRRPDDPDRDPGRAPLACLTPFRGSGCRSIWILTKPRRRGLRPPAVICLSLGYNITRFVRQVNRRQMGTQCYSSNSYLNKFFVERFYSLPFLSAAIPIVPLPFAATPRPFPSFPVVITLCVITVTFPITVAVSVTTSVPVSAW